MHSEGILHTFDNTSFSLLLLLQAPAIVKVSKQECRVLHLGGFIWRFK